MNIGLIVNARGKMCLVHDESFDAPPLFVGYHMDKRQIEIFLGSGSRYLIDWEATEDMDSYLQKIDKILMIRMEEKKPIEGYDTSLFHCKNGKPIELDDPASEDSQAVEHALASPAGLQSLHDANFEAEMQVGEKPVLVMFLTEWSGPAAEAMPTLEELSAELGDRLRIVLVDAEQNAMTAAKCDIKAIPSLALFVSGQLVESMDGAIQKTALQNWLADRI